MAQLPLRQAAKQVGVSRQTVYRMVKDGRLSATVGADGQKVVDTAELLRVFGRLEPGQVETVTRQGGVLPRETGGATAPPVAVAMTEEDRRQQYEVSDRTMLRVALDAAREALKRAEEQLREAKEREAKLLDLAAASTRLLEHREAAANPPKGFWRRVFGK